MWFKCLDDNNNQMLINTERISYVAAVSGTLQCSDGAFIHTVKTLEGEPATVQRWMELIDSQKT